MMLSSNSSPPWVTAKAPVQLMAVGVADGIRVAVDVFDGVKVIVGGRVLVGVRGDAVRIASYVALNVAVVAFSAVAVFDCSSAEDVLVGTRDGVAVSALKPVGKAEPKMGTEIRNVRALAETTSNGSIATIGRIGSYDAET